MYTYATTKKGFWVDDFANFKEDMGGTVRGYDAIMDENGSSGLVLFQNALAEYQTSFFMYHRLLVDEASFKEHLEEEAKAEKERAITDKELEEFSEG
nr:hypothetical protein [Tanacetum cinerariifolium]